MINQENRDAALRLYEAVDHSPYFSGLLLNGYNSGRYNDDMHAVMRNVNYNSDLKKDVYNFLDVIGKGVETHELIGRDKVEELEKHHGKKYKKKGVK